MCVCLCMCEIVCVFYFGENRLSDLEGEGMKVSSFRGHDLRQMFVLNLKVHVAFCQFGSSQV